MRIKSEVIIKSRNLNLQDKSNAMREMGSYMVSSTQKKIKEKKTPPNAPLTVALKDNALPLRDTGMLQSSITFKSDDKKAVIGTNRAGAAMNNSGKVLRARLGKYIWIPATKEAKLLLASAGSINKMIKRLKADGYGCFKNKKGSAFMRYKKDEEPKNLEVFFILKKKVVIPARPFLYVDDFDRKVLDNIAWRSIKNDS